MLVELNTKKVQEFAHSIYYLTRMSMAVLNGNYEQVAASGADSALITLCARLRSMPSGGARCRHCEREACKFCDEAGASVHYVCPLGIKTVVVPIQYANLTVGYVLGDRHIPNHGAERVLAGLRRAFSPQELEKVDAGAFLPAQKNENDDVERLAKLQIIEACAMHIAKFELVVSDEGSILTQLYEYIQKNLSSGISLSALSAELNMSKTTINRYLKRHVGMSTQEFVRKIRTEVAKSYLAMTEINIREIAFMVGIPDYNYFSKFFRAQTGISPSKYRQCPKIFAENA